MSTRNPNVSRLGIPLVVFALATYGCGGGGGSGSGNLPSSPSSGIYAGVVLDSDGHPVSGATVSVEGISASSLTDSSGYFMVQDPELAASALGVGLATGVVAPGTPVEVAVVAPGHGARISSLLVTEGSLLEVDLVESGMEPTLTVTKPVENACWVVPAGCDAPVVDLEGFATLSSQLGFRLDVVLVLDRSESTARAAFGATADAQKSVLDVEIEAAQCFLEGLDPNTTRACAIAFNDEASVLCGFSSDMQEVSDAIVSGIGHPDHGTNFDAAFQKATDVLLALESDDGEPLVPEESGEAIPAPFRAVVFLSDGIATSHGVPRDTSDSNVTQSREDRRAAIESTRVLGEETSAQLFAYSLIPAGDTNRTRTTLPHCVAACGGGAYETIADMGSLGDALCARPLVSRMSVTVVNETADSDPVSAELHPDGFFSARLPLVLTGSQDESGAHLNTLRVTLEAFSGPNAKTAEQLVTVRVMDEATHDALFQASEIWTAQAADKPLSQVGKVSGPDGKPLKSQNLYAILAGANTGAYKDAVQLYGVQSFTPTGMGASNTVTVDFVYRNACFKSDIGYLLLDPDDMPSTALSALQGVPSDQVLWNLANVEDGCTAKWLAAGAYEKSVEVPQGKVLALFVIPNRTLAEYRAKPKGGLDPIFTIPSLNQGGFDQVLAFRSIAGRHAPGNAASIQTAGPLMLWCVEDIPAASSNSDRDHDDMVLTLRGEGDGSMPSAICE